LTEAGIDTGIFKAHSVRGASSSTAASAGVTKADILKAADWLSAGNFQKFISALPKFQITNRPLRQQFCHLSNLHVDIETELSEI